MFCVFPQRKLYHVALAEAKRLHKPLQAGHLVNGKIGPDFFLSDFSLVG